MQRYASRIAICAAGAQLLLLASLHVLSPEFDPSWRVVSEYAFGSYGWILSLMFATGAMSVWALGIAVWPHLVTRGGKIGLLLLMVSGVGAAMASVFDIHHPLMHNVSGAIGIPSMLVAAGLISATLSRAQPWRGAKKSLRWSAHLIWISLAAFIASMVILTVTFVHAVGHLDHHVKVLPQGVIAFNGWMNRLYVVACAAWVITVAQRLSKSATHAPGPSLISWNSQVPPCTFVNKDC